MNKEKKYRPGVGILLLNDKNEIFAGRRIDSISEANPWQMPQGGIDENEDPDQAALRELYEETGIKSVKILAKTEWLYYDLPKDVCPSFWGGKYVGQRQIWYKMQFVGSEDEISLDHYETEFSNWCWTNKDFLTDNIINFKQDLYREVFKALL